MAILIDMLWIPSVLMSLEMHSNSDNSDALSNQCFGLSLWLADDHGASILLAQGVIALAAIWNPCLSIDSW